jgi:hypothetical protein
MSESINIEIPIELRQPLIKVLESRQNELQELVDKLQNELNVISTKLSELTNGEKGQRSQISGTLAKRGEEVVGKYDKNWNQVQKVFYLLKRQGRPVGSGELADLQRKYEPELERDKLVAAISSILTSKSSRKRFLRTQNERNQFVYTLLEKMPL